MTIFYFNNCHPVCNDKEKLSTALSNTLSKYKILKLKYPDEVDGVVSLEIAKLLFGDLSLQDVITTLEKEQRNYAHSIFNKFPMEYFLDVESALEDSESYEIKLDGNSQDAFYLKIAYDNSAVLFSLGLNNELCKNQVIISDTKPTLFELYNLYGADDNCDHIDGIIANELNSKRDNLGIFKSAIGDPVLSSKFIKSFTKVSSDVQKELIDGFKKVLEFEKKGEKIPETILKHNSDDAKLTLSYLKIRDPQAMRLYFSKLDDQYYIASLEKKPLKERKTTEQSTHMKNARSMVRQMKAITSK